MVPSDDTFWNHGSDSSLPLDGSESAIAGRHWAWLEHMRQRFGPAIEVLDRGLRCVLATPSRGHAGAALRAILQDARESAACQVATLALRAGVRQAVSTAGLRIRFLPLVADGGARATWSGVLVIADYLPDRTGASADALSALDRRLDDVLHWLGPAVEATIASAQDEAERNSTARRLEAMVGAVGGLERFEHEDDVVRQMMEAAGLWYGHDVRVYRQEATGAFVLDDYLPGLDLHRAPTRLAGSLVSGHDSVFRLGSSEVEALGWDRAPGDTLFVPIGAGESTDWLIAVSGAAGESAGPTLSFLHHIAGIVLENIESRRRVRLERVLTELLRLGDAPVESAGRLGLQALAHEIDAHAIDLQVAGEPHIDSPLLVAWRDAASVDVPAPGGNEASPTIEISERVGDVIVALSMSRRGRAFTAAALRLARMALDLYGLWLSGVLVSQTPMRATADSDRAVDLAGRLRGHVDASGCLTVGGAVAVMLPEPPHSTGPELDEVMRLLQDHVRSSDVIGAVDHGAGVLLPNATERAAASLVTRLRDAVRDRGLATMHIGMTTFGPFSAAPEALLTRASAHALGGDSPPPSNGTDKSPPMPYISFRSPAEP